MNLVVVSHAYVVPENRSIWRSLALNYPDCFVTLIVPTHWSTDRYGEKVAYETKPIREDNYAVVPADREEKGLARYRALGRKMRGISPDLVYIAQERYDWSTLQTIADSRLCAPGAKIVGGSTVNIQYDLHRLHHRVKEWFFSTATDAIVAMNKEARELLRAHGYKKPILVQHGIGADEEVWCPLQTAKDKRENETSGMTVGYVGALVPEKGVLDLASALVNLNVGWRLVVIGDGPMRRHMELILEGKKSTQYVGFLGMMPREKIPPIMRTFDMLILPSRTTQTWKEQFGLVLIEAMLSGVPVVGSDSGAIPEVIGDAGLIFPEGNVPALQACLQKLLDNPVRAQEIGAKGRSRAMAHFSTTVLAEEFYQFCKSLLA